MARPRGNRRSARITVSLDEKVQATLSVLARRQDVSVAWLVRRAVSDFIDQHGQLVQPELPLSRTESSKSAASLSKGE